MQWKMKKKTIIMIILSFLILCGCANGNNKQEVDVIRDDNFQADIQKEKDKEFNEIDTKIMKIDSGNARINALIDDVVKLTDEENVEYSQWVEEGQIYRVAIERIQENPVEYSHLRDYFFIDTDDGINSFEVDYPSKLDINADRYVYDACEFEADYIDVNFDGNKDIVISLGHQGSNGDMVSCAYVYENGEYVYKKSFENIPNYRIDNSEKLIIGTFSSGPDEHVDIKYAYQDGNFIKISEESGIAWE